MPSNRDDHSPGNGMDPPGRAQAGTETDLAGATQPSFARMG
jgi:hypothetical protein